MLSVCIFVFICTNLLVYTSADCTISSYPPDRRVQSATLAVKAIILDKSKDSADLWIQHIYKGGEKLAVLTALPKHLAFSDISDRHVQLNVSLESNCPILKPTNKDQVYIFILERKAGKIFIEPNPGSIIPFSEELERKILKQLGWSNWSEWGHCSASCAGGEQSRQRHCKSGGGCKGSYSEVRFCNMFPCQGLQDLLNLEKDQYFKPSRRFFKRIPGKHHGVHFKLSSYLLYPMKEAFEAPFPREFSLFINFKIYSNSKGILLSLTNPEDKENYLSLEFIQGDSETGVQLQMVQASHSGQKKIGIPISVNINQWTYLAISVDENDKLKFYSNCKWVTTLTSRLNIHSSNKQHKNGERKLEVGEHPDVAIGYLFQGDIEQILVSENPEDVSELCSLPKAHTRKEFKNKHNKHIEAIEHQKSFEYEYDEEEVSEGSGHHQDIDADPFDDDYEGSGGLEEISDKLMVEWSNWSACTASCGSHATQTRLSRCQDSARMMECIQSGLERRVIRSCQLPPCQDNQNDSYSQSTDSVSQFQSSHITSEDMEHFRNKFKPADFNQTEEQTTSAALAVDACGCTVNGGCSADKSRCECKAGWKGKDCSTPVCQPECNQGKCVEPDVCSCKSGYTGARCNQAFCYPGCENGGMCISPFTCRCTPGFSGQFCQQDLCLSSCKNGGTCIGENNCVCPHGFSGSDCSDFTCTARCLNGGVCTGPNTCTCTGNYVGEQCEQRICPHLLKTKVPIRKAFKRFVTKSSGENSETDQISKTYFKTYYKTVFRCIGE